MRHLFRIIIVFATLLLPAGPALVEGAEPLRLAAPVLQGAQLRLEWSGGAGPFQLQQADSPNGPWLDAGSPIDGTNTAVDVVASGRFFRVGGVSTGDDSGEQALMATMQAVEAYVKTVPTADRAAWRTQVLSFLNGRADIDSAGETPDGVWAVTTDGVPLAFWNNRLPDPFDPNDVAQEIHALGAQTPGNTSARFATTVGAGFRLAGPRVSRQLSTHGYAASFDSASLDSLKGQRNESVFFFNTHGGAFGMPRFGLDGRPQRGADGNIIVDTVYGLWSGTKVDPNSTAPGYNHATFMSEVKAKRLALAFATFSYTTDAAGNETAVNEWHFGITAEWVSHYMTFPKQNHASIWLAACLSGSGAAAPMRSAFRGAGAEMVSSWTQTVTGDAVLSATSFLYDRLLGANEVQAPETPQRPFDYENCWTELRSKGLHKHSTIDENGNAAVTEIVYEGATGDDAFGLFAPSIAYVLISEVEDRAILKGIFGVPPENERHVMIDGTEAAIVSWEPRKIVCSLARTGGGSAGDVQVIVHGLKSNVRRITRWTVNGTYKWTEEGSAHAVNGTLKLIFRADVGEYRKEPGNVFIRPTRSAAAAQSSEVRLDASGVDTFPCGDGRVETITWEGSGLFPSSDPSASQLVLCYVSLDTIDEAGALGLAFGLRDPDQFSLRIKSVLCDGPTFNFPLAPAPAGPASGDPLIFGSPIEELYPDGSKIEIPLPGGIFVFGSDWAISAGSADSEADSGMKWNRAEAEFPPSPDAAR